MTITLNIPDTQATQVVEGICQATGWAEDSGLTKAAWAKNQVISLIKETAKRGLVRQFLTTNSAAIDPLNIT